MAALLPIWAATGTVTPPDSSKISVGWLLGEKPPHEFMNWWQQEMVLRLNHILAQGVPEWDTTTPYPLNAHVKRLGLVYKATTANTGSQPPSANWLQISQNASALDSGVVPDARISGSYTNFTTIVASGAITGGSLNALGNVAVGGIIAHSSGNLSLRTGTSSTNRLVVADTGVTVVGTITGTTFAGSGSGLTGLNASQLTTGTVPSARLAGDYSFDNLTLTGALSVAGQVTAGQVTSSPGTGATNGYNFGAPGSVRLNTPADNSDFRVVIGGVSRLIVSATTITASGSAIFTGSGSGLTGLNASQLTTGTVNDARLPTIMAGKSFSSGIDFASRVGASAADMSQHIDLYGGVYGFGVTGSRLNIIASAAATVRFVFGTADGGGYITPTGFVGNGSGLTALNASQLTTGTLPNARLVGNYSFDNLTLSGDITTGGQAFIGSTLNVGGVIRHSAGNLSLRTGTSSTNRLQVTDVGITVAGTVSATALSGNGSGITALNASELDSGTVPTARLGTTTADRNWVGARYAEVSAGAIGSVIMAHYGNNNAAYDTSVAGASLTPNSIHQSDDAADVSGGSVSLTGNWRCCGTISSGAGEDKKTTVWRRIN